MIREVIANSYLMSEVFCSMVFPSGCQKWVVKSTMNDSSMSKNKDASYPGNFYSFPHLFLL